MTVENCNNSNLKVENCNNSNLKVENCNNSNKKVGNCKNSNKENAKFPEGLEVLAVDDSPPCLKILVQRLRFCKYEVTATNSARSALQILRENKDKFDLVITDVHMPDMDGFKLLELIGLEMDLPVIMLSVNEEKDTVMRGITHGACDYLLKPVRIEELKLIWKHVIMKKSKSNPSNNLPPTGGELAPINNNNNDNVNVNNNNNNVVVNNNARRRRRNQDEDEEEEEVEEGRENEERGHRRRIKARVVWTTELHHKFIDAVNALGIDKAVPKSILNKMAVAELTRENVASHLQKYRLYLKRLRNATPHQQMQAAYGSRNNQYVHLTYLQSFQNYHSSGRYRQYVPALPPYQSPNPNFNTNQITASTSSLALPTNNNINNSNNNNGVLVNSNNINNLNNNVNNNNQNNMLMGVGGNNSATYSYSYTTQTNNGITYLPSVGQITNLPSTVPLTGENTGNELQQVVAAFNNLSNISNNNNNTNININNNINFNNNINSGLGTSMSSHFNPGMNVNNSSLPIVGTSGEITFGTGTGTSIGTGSLVLDQVSSNNNGGDNSGLNNDDDLLNAMLKPTDRDPDEQFVDDMFAD